MAQPALSSDRKGLEPAAPPTETLLPPQQRVTLASGASLLDGNLAISPEPLRIAKLNAASMAEIEQWLTGESVGASPQSQRLAAHLLRSGIVIDSPPSTEQHLGDITVVIPVHNDEVGLPDLLDYCERFQVSVIVVDDGSTPSLDISQIAPRAKLIRHESALGPAAARNAGYAAASTPWVLFVDSDVNAQDFDLGPFSVWCGREDVALVAPRVKGQEGSSLRERFDECSGPLDLGREPGRIGARKSIPFVPSAVMLLRRNAVDVPFDETLLVGEDVDLVWRLDEAGWTLLYRPEHVVVHRTRAQWSSWMLQRYRYASSAAALAMRHEAAAAPLRGSAVSVGAWVALMSGSPITALSLFTSAKRRLDNSLEHLDGQAATAAIFTKAVIEPGPRLARQLIRTYGPGLLLGALASKRIRRFAMVAIVCGGLERWWRSERNLDPLQYLAISTLDDLSYAVGLSAGAIQSRSPKVLIPRLTWKAKR